MNERILITGAGSGFGCGAAFELARRGREVIASTETEEQAAALRAAAQEEGITLRAEKLDIRDEKDRVRAQEWGVMVENPDPPFRTCIPKEWADKVREVLCGEG